MLDDNNASCYTRRSMISSGSQQISPLTQKDSVSDRLRLMKESRRNEILGSTLFRAKQKLSSEELIKIFSQYWRPLNYFPDFLASALLAVDTLKEKGAIAKVLAEELGEGTLERSHEYAYFRALEFVGVGESEIRNVPENNKTKLLMDGYRSGRDDPDRAIGYFLSTEVADLWIVSSLGKILLQNMEVKRSVEWIDLHVTQEPGHVTSAAGCLDGIRDHQRLDRILSYADECSARWDLFFAEIAESVGLKPAIGVM